ncbi:hypothetical protein G6M14_08755 [Agrobacterium tumefaciens]|uniref:hypothetical protein n=1 Tax=Agrobacterium tumefaciens TaxID=358 RepID=UPI0015735C38|nr:hypothetical protein [Agrobacterium tumefaciens]
MNKPLALDAQQNVTAQRLSMGALELHLKNVIAERPRQARLAATDELARMWFVAELASVADGRIPLPAIEALVSKHLASTKGGDA